MKLDAAIQGSFVAPFNIYDQMEIEIGLGSFVFSNL
jgi:hypothetical protein